MIRLKTVKWMTMTTPLTILIQCEDCNDKTQCTDCFVRQETTPLHQVHFPDNEQFEDDDCPRLGADGWVEVNPSPSFICAHYDQFLTYYNVDCLITNK